ncbi:glutamate--tRNA ligase [Candidatus Bathyarchaeota archaeon]|nr:glutamate--tRNA ligase [Candidatus Bathyarchaeota archaeon]
MSRLRPEVEALARKHALVNACRHGGKAETGAVIAKLMSEVPDLRSQARIIHPEIVSLVQEINQLTLDEQTNLVKSSYGDLLGEKPSRGQRPLAPLPDAEIGHVVTRFPPEPNGYPHIGHAKAAILDEEYARHYEGRFILRFDDTNPANELQEYYGAIQDGLEWLGIKPDLIKNTSDDLETIYSYAEQLIEKSGAYVCTCAVETIRANRASGIECECRTEGPANTLKLWQRMSNEMKPNEAVLRLKGDMSGVNTAFRDPILFRINHATHPLKGTKYTVWPTYDFAAPIEDSLDGVTHAMRTKEYELRDVVYYHVLDMLGIRKPLLLEFSRLELKDTPISKRKLKPLIENGTATGWDDPRLPTLTGLRRRGYHPQSIRAFVMSLGLTKTESRPTWDLLESLNRKVLDPIARRYFFVPNPVRVEIGAVPDKLVRIPFHPDQAMGYRTIPFSGAVYIPSRDAEALRVGSVFRLIELFNVEIRSVEDGHLSGSFVGNDLIQHIPKLQWVSEQHIEQTVAIPGPFFEDDKLSPKSWIEEVGFAEPAAGEVGIGELIQFVRCGFCRVDAPNLAIMTHK